MGAAFTLHAGALLGLLLGCNDSSAAVGGADGVGALGGDMTATGGSGGDPSVGGSGALGPGGGAASGGAGGGGAASGGGGVAGAGGDGGLGGQGGAPPTLVNGDSCALASQCLSGFCVDDVCCDTACEGACVSCDGTENLAGNGVCSPVFATTDPDADCPETECATGACDGAGACEVLVNTTSCRSSAGPCDVEEFCDGVMPLCPADETLASGENCGGYACISGDPACPSSCIDDSDCALAHDCNLGLCEFTGKRVFVTTSGTTGLLGGLGGADMRCQTIANAAGLPGTFRAWLSAGTASAASRLTHATVPYGLLDGTVIALDWDDLVDGTLMAPIRVGENGLPTIVGSGVWTGTAANGDTLTNSTNCAGWNANGANQGGTAGNRSQTGPAWTEGTNTCFANNSLYCFEQ